MELKLGNILHSNYEYKGFNRTFMELKLAYAAMRILYKITK